MEEESITTVTSVLWLPPKSLVNIQFGDRAPLPNSVQSHSMRSDIVGHISDIGTPDGCASTPGPLPTATDELGTEFDMENYDNEDATDNTRLFSVIDADMELAKRYDEYMNDEVSDSEDEDYYQIKDDDVLFVAANVEEDACTIEVYLHDTLDGGMYVHHDFMISSYPLALEYIPSMGSSHSLLAVGAFDPKIDIWELAVHDPIEPLIQLGKKKGHTDAVISLHLCPQNQTVLASGSADSTVRIWDLNKGASITTLSHHKDKVQSVRWHPLEAGILMTSGYDKTVNVSDQRQDSKAAAVVKLASDPECSIWSRHSPSVILVSDENGYIHAHDVRKVGQSIWSIQAHMKAACTSFTDTMGHPDLLVSCGTDGVANIWKTDKCSTAPQPVFARELGAGPLFSVGSNNEDPSLVVFGASCPVLWNITDNDVVCKTFPSLPGADQPNIPIPDHELVGEYHDED